LLEVYNLCIASLCANLSPRFVIGLIVKNTSDSNKPKVVSECCTTIGKIIIDYGVHSINLKDVVEYAKAGLGQANPVIKKASQSLTVTIYSYIGDKLTPLLSDVKEATLKVLQEEFSKTEIITNATFKSVKGEEAPKSMDPRKMLDDVLPRANIEKLITPAILKKLADGNWKIRKEGLDDIEGILESNGMRILPIGLEVLIKALVGRINDPNKSLVRQCLLLTGKLAAALGMESKNFARHLLPPIISCLADKMNLLRQDAMTAINKWAEEAGTDIIIVHASAPLCIENPELRSELLGWLLEHKDKFKENDMKPYVQGTLACLQDKTAPIRVKAESLFEEIVKCIGFESFNPYLKDIKPAVMSTLTTIFDKYRHRSAPELDTSDSISLPPKRSKDPPTTARSGSKESQKSKGSGPLKMPSDSDLKTSTRRQSERKSTLPSFDIGILVNGSKSKRLEAEAKCKWTVEDIRQDYQDKLKEQMRTSLTPDLFALVYNKDFKKQLEGVNHITNLIPAQTKEIIEVLDVIFKWVWVRMQEVTNTQLIKGILEMLDILINTLQKESYQLQDIEANLFLPIICEKSGQNNVQFKNMIRGIIHFTAKIYPPDRVFMIVLVGCNSKNTKSKVECLEELAELIKEYGIEITHAKDIKSIAKHASSTDNNVRTTAVQTMGEIYKLIGEKVWGMIGEIPDKVKDLFEQRFRAVSGTMLKRGSKDCISKITTPKNKSLGTSFDGSRAATPVLQKEEDFKELSKTDSKSILRVPLLDIKDIKDSSDSSPITQSKLITIESSKIPDIKDIPDIPPDIPKPKPIVQEEKKIPIQDMEIPNESLLYEHIKIPTESLLYDPFKFDESTSDLDRHIETLRNGDMSSRVDALVAINDIVLNNLETHKEELQKKANQLSDALTKVIIITFDKPINEIPLRFAKYFLNVVHKVCCTKIIMRELNETSLFALAEQILIRLLIEELEKLGEKGEGELMLRTLNGTMLRILEHCRPTRIFLVLIRLLTKHKSGASLQKMTGLIIRCLLKLTRIMASLINQIEIDKLLLAMHEYLVQSKLSSSDDAGSKTIKTILTEVVKLQGPAVWQAYEEIKKHPVPDVQIEKWINAMISSSSYTVNNVVSPKNQLTDPVLSEIFSVVRQDYNTGLNQLRNHLEKNPNADIKYFLSTLPEETQKKINEDLEEWKNNKNSNKEPNPSGYNFQEFKQRLIIMKERYGLIDSKGKTELTDAITDLKAKVSTSKSTEDTIKSRIQKFKGS
jgi:cytoskeleton-associated protein 5